jgi:transcriptional regulator with XRE-family HTH domain
VSNIVVMPTAPRDRDQTTLFGFRFMLARKAIGLTQEELAEQLAVARTTITSFENGSRMTDPPVVARFHARHKITADWVYLGDLSGLPHKIAQRIEELQANPQRARRRGRA